MNKIWNLPKIEFCSFVEIEERRPVLLVTSTPAWNAVKENLRGLNVTQIIEVTEANTAYWDILQSKTLAPHARLHQAQVPGSAGVDNRNSAIVYAAGGGLVADAAKYFATKLNLPLVCLPTALSVDAFLTAASGIRKDGCVYYMETKPPETLIVDFEVITNAPASIRAAGITDVMSIATGSWDWKFAHEHAKNPQGMEFIPWVYDNAQSILNGVLDCAEAAGRGDRDGLKSLLDCLCMEVQLCNQIGHARPEEGSEHYFAYLVENFVGHGLPHGDLVGIGILLIAQKQAQDVSRMRRVLEACHIPLNKIPQEVIEKTLVQLPAYCQKHGLAFGIAHTLNG